MERARPVHRILALAAIAALLPWPSGMLLSTPDAQASNVTSAKFTGTTGTFTSADGTLFAKAGAALKLELTTNNNTKCVTVAGAMTSLQTSSEGKSSWTLPVTAPADANGPQVVTVNASPNTNVSNNACTGGSGTMQASYTLDSAGPEISTDLAPSPNTAGWNNTDVTVKWTATDPVPGAGIVDAQPFRTQRVTANGISTLTTPAQLDRLGNAGKPGAVTVRVDKDKPTITAAQKRNADGTTTISFTCDDVNSGAVASSGVASCLADGTTTSSKTVKGGETVTGTATDNAGNTASVTSVAPPSDATAPTIDHAVAPAPNAAGWNKADATVTFSCDDNAGGSGMKSCVADGTNPASSSKTVATETNGTLVDGTATDNAGNTAKRSVTVKLDKTAPIATATRTPAGGNAAGWNNTDVTVSFACADPGTQASGVKTCPASKILSTDGANQSATGAATDNADNTGAAASVNGINIDKIEPSLSGAPTSAPNGNGWYKGDVAVKWTADDATSGLANGVPANSTITGEGEGLKASTSVADKAGNTTTADSAAVRIDRTAPVTGISGTSNDWTNGVVNVTLAATDNLSGVASTTYTVDGGAQQTGSSFTLSDDGDHTVRYFSTDNAGNAGAVRTAQVMIDKTAPTIGHAFTPGSYKDAAWTNADVTVTFTCADQGGSDVATCTGPVDKTTEGEGQQVVGTATDNAGNSATDTAVVSIDKTAPTIAGKTDRNANDAGWFNDDVTVSFSAADALSGVAGKTGDKVLGEGADQSVTGTATDAAGNKSTDTVGGVNVDKTAPVLDGTFTAGWHKADVTVNWSCTDALSGVAKGPADATVTGEGANLSSTAACADTAGNSASKTVGGIKIDRTAPATGATVSGPIANGWYTGGVSVKLAASDNLSGVEKTYYTVDGGEAKAYTDSSVAIEGDGTHTVVFWSTDFAGNVEDKAGNTVTLKLDKTPPSLSGKATSEPNGDGWYKGDVTVAWTCSDATSGIDGTCPADSTVGGEGDSLTAAASVSDKAGNATSNTVGGIKIDRTAPTTTADVPAAPASGWYGADVQVQLRGSDNLSGVKATYYTVDGGEPKTYGGAFTFGTEGTHEIAFWSTDKAGNVEAAGAPITLKIDKTAPATEVINPISPDSGWFVTSGIPFAFKVSDQHSGIAATYYTIDGGEKLEYGEPFTQDLSTGVHDVTYWSVDIAGNKEATRTLQLKVDTIAPAITGSQSPAPNSFGWNNTDVDVKFTCTDADSGINGIAGCAGETKLVNDGAGQKVTGDAVDVAGNRSSTEFGPVKIDKTKPTLAGVPGDANGAGWHKDDVTVKWVGDDALSGIDPATQPADSTVKGEGSNLGAGPVTIKDKAGNTSDPASVSGIKIDRTAPVVAGGPTAPANAAGWYKSAVTVDFTCTDSLSGMATCPTSKVLEEDGVGQSVTSDPATDKAGNASAGKTVGPFKIDSKAPQTSADNQCDGRNGYCKGQTATVNLTAVDQDGLSGVKEIRYTVNGGGEQIATGASVSVKVPLAAKSGLATVTYRAVDHAGNLEGLGGVSLKYDNIAPSVTHKLTPEANAAGWNDATTTVHFDATDDDGGSGVDVGSVTPDVTVSDETAGQVVNGSALDIAGNKGTDSATVKLDKTAPTITAAITNGTKNASGWYSGQVTVTFTCGDSLSGVATCPDAVVLAANGENTASGTVTDRAGNTATASIPGIRIDQEKPTLTTADVNVNGKTYTVGAVPTATCTATDSFSGLDSCKVTVTGGNANGVGTFTYTAIATDKAGNSTTITGSYTVKYRFDGFLQPINDTAHQIGVSTSVFKAGSTVPAKFQLKKADGTLVQAASAPVWLAPAMGSATSAPVDESVYSLAADSGSSYKYDATGQQYHYNWKSGSKAGNYWRIGVKLDDGLTYYVNIGLR